MVWLIQFKTIVVVETLLLLLSSIGLHCCSCNGYTNNMFNTFCCTVVVTVLLIMLSIHCCTFNSFTKAYSAFDALFNCGFIKSISVDHHGMRGRTKLGAQVITINPKRVRTGRGVTYTLITRLLLLSAHAGGITPLFRPTSSPPDPLFPCSCRGLGWGMGRF